MMKEQNLRKRAGYDLLVFAAILVVCSAAFELAIVRDGLTPTLFVPLVWVPCLAGVAARLVSGQPFAAGSFQLTRLGVFGALVGMLYPLMVAIPAYGIAWTSGLGHFAAATMHPLGFAIPGGTDGTRLLASVIIAITIAPLAMGILAVGEEIGWRGYLLPRLIAARVPRPLLMTNLIWSLWHAPLIISQRYMPSPRPVLSLLLFTITLCGLGWVIASLRLRTRSIWPGVAVHAAWNAFLVAFFHASTQGEQAALWVGEGGFLVALCAIASAILWRKLALEFLPRGPSRL